jgi:hypothetical protein
MALDRQAEFTSILIDQFGKDTEARIELLRSDPALKTLAKTLIEGTFTQQSFELHFRRRESLMGKYCLPSSILEVEIILRKREIEELVEERQNG